MVPTFTFVELLILNFVSNFAEKSGENECINNSAMNYLTLIKGGLK